MDDVRHSGGLDEGVEEPGDEDPRAGGALSGMAELAKEALERLYWDGGGGEELDAESPGFFHLERVDGHGEPDGIKHYSNPSDVGGRALTLVQGCIQAELRHEVQEVLVVGEG